MRELLPYLKLFKYQLFYLLLGFLCAVLTVFAGWGLIGVASFLVTATFSGLALSMTGARLLSFSFIILRTVGRYFERLSTHDATFRLLEQLRLWFYDALLPLVPQGLEKYRKGDLLNRVIENIDSLDNLYIRILLPSMVALFFLVFTALVFEYFLPNLGILLAGILLFYCVVMPSILMVFARQVGVTLIELQTKINVQILEQIQFMREFLVFNQHKLSIQSSNETQQCFFDTQKKMARMSAFSSAFFVIIWGLTLVIGLLLVAVASELQTIELHWIGVVIFIILIIFEGFSQLPIAFQYFGKTQQSAANLNEVLNKKQLVSFPEKSTISTLPSQFAIEYNNVSCNYEETAQTSAMVLRDINILIPNQEKLGIVGQSGAGKTSLIKLLMRSIVPTNGQILLAGNNIEDYSEADLFNMFSVVAQNSHLFHTTIAENLRLANSLATDDELWAVLQQVELSNFVHRLPQQLETSLGEAASSVSGGQARRLVIARAMLKDAPIVLLDEPTEGLDIITEKSLIASIEKVIANKTAILITHRPHLLSITNRKIEISQGRVITS